MECSLQEEMIASLAAGRLLGFEVILYGKDDKRIFCIPIGRVGYKEKTCYNAETITFPEIIKGTHIKSFGIRVCGSDRVLFRQEFGKIYFASAGDKVCFHEGDLSFEVDTS